ncbi:MAG: hypothetical protein PVG30_04905 [Gammaproteobacteria bacterium]|jgi:hypothetical protein
MRKLLISIIALTAAILSTYSYAQTPNKQTTTPQSTTKTTATENQTATNQQQTSTGINLLFILTAKTAILKANRSGLYTLTFIGVNPYLTYYTNRPNRTQGLAAVENFMKAWNVGPNSFQTNPPNAVITAAKINNLENSDQQFYLFTLTSPKYNQQQGAIQFVAQSLSQKIYFKDVRFDNVMMVID